MKTSITSHLKRLLLAFNAAVLVAGGISAPAQPGQQPLPDTGVSPAVNHARFFDERHRTVTYSGPGWTDFDGLGPGWKNGTARSSRTVNDFFQYTHPSCTRLKWFGTRSNSRGRAEVFLDGTHQATVDTYSSATEPSSVIFDSGELQPGSHVLKVVVLHQKRAESTDYWVECDGLEVTVSGGLPIATALPRTASIPGAAFWNDTHGSVLCFGNWDYETDQPAFHDRDFHTSNVQFNTCEFRFRGSAVRWFGARNHDHGFADVYLDGALQQTVDAYAPTWVSQAVLFERTGLKPGLHVLKIVVRKERNPKAVNCYQTIDRFEAEKPVDYRQEITAAMTAEYAAIANGSRTNSNPAAWTPMPYAATSPYRGVTLFPGPFKDAFERNIQYLEHCFVSKTYCDGPGWYAWLPGSNEGRLLQGAANSLRWGERAGLRKIVDTVVTKIDDQQRADGYHNYYPEEESFALETGANSERKNYDRVFWTRGLLDAGRAGNPQAYGVIRRFYDWFATCSYLPRMIHGFNSPNGFPGGPLVYHSPIGKPEDLFISERYFDQDYWIHELRNREPLCFTFYPGERPHCYDLLGLEAYLDQYRATGARKYHDAVLGGWDTYRDSFKHVGGTTAICESRGPYPPGSCKLTSGCTGETCGSVFWMNINSRLMQLYPTVEKYAAEVEESIYNVILACQHTNGYIRYHNRLHGEKEAPQCQGTCCECSVVGVLAKLPEYIYSTDSEGVFVNLYVPSSITWTQGQARPTLTQQTSFPDSPAVILTLTCSAPTEFKLRFRVPSWATNDLAVEVNGEFFASGAPGSYVTVARTWTNHDRVSFTLPMGFTTVQYTGVDQAPENVDRYAVLHGPVLLAIDDAEARIRTEARNLVSLLSSLPDRPLHYAVKGTPYRFMPYWQVNGTFTCFPMVQP